MKYQRTLRRVAVALMLLVAFLFQGTWALAGTTGRLSGTLADKAGAPVVGAVIEAKSPSQTAVAITDAHGHFLFLNLSPDTYTVTAKKAGFNTVSLSGVTVFADQSFDISLVTSPQLKTIATVRSLAAGNLVKAGTTSSVYTVNSTQMKQVASAAGGNNLDTAYSAIYTTPGVVTSSNGEFGFGQVFYIRGSSYSQTGYEFDGVPVNRAFDNYGASSLSNVGVSSTEIYTGGSPASAGASTLGGYINQVIKSGTYPGYGKAQVTIGYPGYRHGLYVQAGGATPDRLFSYYVGLSGTYYNPNFINNQNGGNLNPDGSNAYGLQGIPAFFNSGSGLYGVNTFFAGIGSTRGPWSTCLPSGAAPAGAAMLQAPSDGLGLGAVPICDSYGPLAGVSQELQYGLNTKDTENIINLNFGIPHKRDAGRDSIQVLYDTFGYHSVGTDNINTMGTPALFQQAYSPWGGATGYAAQLGLAPGTYPVYGGNSPTNPYQGLCGFLAFLAPNFGTNPCATTGGSFLSYGDGLYVPSSVTFNSNAAAAAGALKTYYAPNSPTNRLPLSGISNSQLSGVWNTGSIVKLQYQRNINERSYFRLYGYTFYSDWLQNNPNSGANGLGLFGVGYAASSPDYELNSHTRGLSFEYGNQINDKNLVSVAGNYVTSNVTRWYNQQSSLTPGTTPAATLGVAGSSTCYSYIANQDKSGLPYDASYATGMAAGSPVSCLSYLAGQSLGAANAGSLAPVPAGAAAAGASWLMTKNINAIGNLNTVAPTFTTLSLSDEFQPNSRFDFNFGLRFENFKYKLAPVNSPEATYWQNVINQTACVDPNGLAQVPGSDQNGGSASGLPGQLGYPGNLTTLPGAACPVDGLTHDQLYHPGSGGVPLLDLSGASEFTRSTVSPRFGATYTVNPLTVLRFTYGRYVQPTETAFEQVLTSPDGYHTAIGVFNSAYFNQGLATTAHNNPLQYSNNFDISYERHLKGTDVSFRITPYYRYTSQQLVSVQLGSLAGGFNAATQRTKGVEIAIQKGDPSRNGWSGQLSYTYTNARIRYNLINGSNNIAVLHQSMANFLALTKTNGGAACYAGGAASACTAPGAVTNPYYNLLPGLTPSQFDAQYPTSGWYPTYANYFPNGIAGDSTTAFGPNAFTGFLAYKKNRFQAAANFSVLQGSRYGSPFAIAGIDPRSCSANQSALIPGSTLADYQTCGASVPIPNPVTGAFDTIGQYREPWQLNIGGQFTYKFTRKVSGTLVVANLINRCFGGSKSSWTSAYPSNNIVCGYAPNGSYLGYTPGEAYSTAGAGYFTGNTPSDPTNGTAGYPAVFNQPYSPLYTSGGGLPIQLYFQLNVQI
uniref:TonB-dependent receptor plug domain-containing protein n=1 Tax=mine drainage metagenome TaxID=410659 RepID=E6Q558_9ZZZZ